MGGFQGGFAPNVLRRGTPGAERRDVAVWRGATTGKDVPQVVHGSRDAPIVGIEGARRSEFLLLVERAGLHGGRGDGNGFRPNAMGGSGR